MFQYWNTLPENAVLRVIYKEIQTYHLHTLFVRLVILYNYRAGQS